MLQPFASEADSPPSDGPCCVLWIPAADEREASQAPKELIASLERRHLRWTIARDGYRAMAEMLLRVRTSGPKAAVLVLVHPTKLDLSGLVVDSLNRYCGAVAVWRFDPAAQPVLAKAQRHELATVFTRTERVVPRPANPSTKATRPAAEQSPPKRPEPAEREEPTAASLLSEEELSMLLADRPR